MLWERVWPALWPATAVLIVFLILSFLDVWRVVPREIQALALFATVFATVFLLWRHLTRTQIPERREGLRRLETESGLEHRPLTSFEDRPVARGVDPASDALWRVHRARLAEKIRHVGLVLPRTQAAKRDPYALRLLLVLALGVSVLIAGAEWGDRLRSAIAPLMGPPIPSDARVDVWILPPDYTGAPMIALTGDGAQPAADGAAAEPIAIPTGSRLMARFSGYPGRPALALKPLDRPGRQSVASSAPKDGALQAETLIDAPTRAEVRYRGRTLGAWDLTVRADVPPVITMTGPPMPTATASVRFAYEISDDYGVEDVRALITRPPRDETEATLLADDEPSGAGITPDYRAVWPRAGVPVTVTLPKPASRPGTSQETALENLAAHPFAGEEVIVQLAATDGAGQESFSEGQRVTLPERIFIDPLARALIEQRRYLAHNPEDVFTVATALDALTAGADAFIDDSIVYLALRSAYWRLAHHPRPDDVRSVYDMLWDTALRIEDGDLSESLQRLRQVQRMLSDALNRQAPADEIRQLMAQLREALDQYMADLMQQADQMAAEPGADTVDARDLNSILQSIQQMAELGAHDQARNMLAELNQLLETLRPAANGGGTGNGQREASPQEQALTEALGDLSDIISRQRGLMDETYRNTDEAQSGGQGSRVDQMREAFRRALRTGTPFNLTKRRDETLGDFANSEGHRGGAESDLLRKLMREGDDGTVNTRPDMPATRQPGRGASAPTGGDQRRAEAPAPGGGGTDLSGEQDAVREALRALNEELRRAGLTAPTDLDAADRSMAASGQDLRRPDFDAALDDQQAALDQLRAGAEEMAENLMQRQGNRRGGSAGRDPLGRETGDGARGSIQLPDLTDLQRARAILDELRRRAGERTRPRMELDYYERLLRQF